MRRLVACLVLGAAGALAWAAASPGALELKRPCKPNSAPGLITTSIVRILVYCGSAKATVHLGGHTYRFSGGACYRFPNGLSVGIGKLTETASVKPKYRAFWLSTEATKDRTIRDAVVRIQVGGREVGSTKNTLVLKGKLSRGTFTGVFTTGGRGSGSFSCK